jgi:chromosome partitioning protein
VWATEEVESIVGECRVLRPELLAYFLVNRQFPHTRLGKEIADALHEKALQTFCFMIRNRTAYAKAATEGLTVLETEPQGPAANDIRAWMVEACMALEGRGSGAGA